MRHLQTNTSKLFVLFAFISIAALRTPAQINQPRSLITKPVNESQMVMLHGNTHPLARTEFDQGVAPGNLPMENMMLVLKRSPEQEADLATLLREQQDPNSPNYHKWVTPVEFGARFGPSDHDMQAITSWLQSHGFAIINVPAGRNIIQFSGTAAQIQSAFQTAIHRYVVKGEEHWANSSDPQIPAALSDVVAGVNTMHNFRKRPMTRVAGTFRRSNATGQVTPIKSQFTYSGACGNSPCFAVAPFDFATIYNVLPLWNAGIDGTGVTIGIVGDSNVNLADITNFRSNFGLPAKAPTITVPPGATDPGIQKNGDEIEADLDIEWAGAVAKNANIHFAVAANSNAGLGVDLAATYLVNLNPAPAIISESFGLCELGLGAGGNTFFNTMWSQAATEGITVVVSTGDNGASACDVPNSNPNKELPASQGLAVSGIASTPFNIAVGGTDFDELANPSQFWNSSNATTTRASAKGYIPETTWNDSCTNLDYALFAFSAIPEINCNNVANLAGFIDPIGGGGGISNCTAPTGLKPSNCAGGYAKPDFQVGPGVPNDGKRDVPDVSLFAGDGFAGSFYVICEQDIDSPANTACNADNPVSDVIGVGGTSVSTQAFAGIMALVVQKTGDRQGIDAATKMYQLAEAQTIAGCNTAAPGAACVFNDVTKGTISQPCLKNSPNCNLSVSTDANGILAGCDTGPGFDLATGLGSFNANNLVNHFNDGAGAGAVDFSLAIANCNATVMIASPGGSGSFTVVITELNGFNGAFTFACTGMLTESTCNTTTSSIDATHISAKVTVSTVAASTLFPANRIRPGGPGPWTIAGAIALACFLSAGILLLGFRSKQRRLRTALALLTFALLVTMAACGGGSSGVGSGGGGGNAGTPSGQATPTLTVTSGATVHSLTFTQIVD
ncbi:MAG: S53 family peptidase [Candidatus Acidiferrales bacterium]